MKIKGNALLIFILLLVFVLTGGTYLIFKKTLGDLKLEGSPLKLVIRKYLWPQTENQTKAPQIIAKKQVLEQKQNRQQDFILNPSLQIKAEILSSVYDPYLKLAFSGKDPLNNLPLERFQIKIEPSSEWIWSGKYFQLKLEPQKTVVVWIRGVDHKFHVSYPLKITFKNELSVVSEKIQFSLIKTDPLILEIRNLSQESINVEKFKIITPQFEWQFKKTNKILFPFYAKTEEDLILRPKERIILTANPSPVGVDFMINRCLAFYPQLNLYPIKPSSCFLPQIPTNLPNWCKEKLQFLGCRPFAPEELARFSLYPECFDFVNKNLTYAGCFYQHFNKDDFFEDTWYIFTGFYKKLVKYDIIEFKDDQGFLIKRIEIK